MYRFGFILSTSLGNANRYRIFTKYAARESDVEFTWAPVKHYYAPGEVDPVSRVPHPFYTRAVVLTQSWPVLGQLRRFDAVMIHQLEAQPLALIFSKLINGPLIIAAQDNPPVIDLENYPPYENVVNAKWWRRKLRLQAELWIARQTSSHVTFSGWQAAILTSKCGISPDCVHAIHTGMDLTEWPAPQPKQKKSKPAILFVGGDFDRKGGELLLRVYYEHFLGKATLNIVTSKPISVTHPDIAVHTGLAPGDGLLKSLYASADIFVLPTQADLSPWVCLEAMASGTPVIASDMGAIGDLVRNGLTGLLVKPRDPVDLRIAIQQLVENPLRRLEMGNEGRRVVELEFDASINVPRIIGVMKTATDRRRRKS
jgi:glycosyltransferase involved in cell wall biosynthesis